MRVIAATGVDLSRAVADELFDPELYERLGARASRCRRCAAVPTTCRSCSSTSGARVARDRARQAGRFKQRALDRLIAYSWPGNVAELKRRGAPHAAARGAGHVELADVDAVLPPVEERVPVEQLSFEEMVRAKIRAPACSGWTATPSRTFTRRSSRASSGRSSSWCSSAPAATSCKRSRDPRPQPQHAAQEDRRAQRRRHRAGAASKYQKVTATGCPR